MNSHPTLFIIKNLNSLACVQNPAEKSLMLDIKSKAICVVTTQHQMAQYGTMSVNKAFSGILPPCAYEEGRSLKSKLVVSLVMTAIRDYLMSFLLERQ